MNVYPRTELFRRLNPKNEWWNHSWINIDIYELEPDEHLDPKKLLARLINSPNFKCDYVGSSKTTGDVHNTFFVTSFHANSYIRNTKEEAIKFIQDFPYSLWIDYPEKLAKVPRSPSYETDDQIWIQNNILAEIEKTTSTFWLDKKDLVVNDRYLIDDDLFHELVIITPTALLEVVMNSD